jgi:UDP-N-acetylglucosamine diphosphorylase/glucosamine-1-phosphate N-acetyltransferase
MSNYILFDDDSWGNLLPLTFTRPVCEIRTGILKIKEKWELMLKTHCSYLTQEYLRKKYGIVIKDMNVVINGSVIPNAKLLAEIKVLKPGEVLVKDKVIVAVILNEEEIRDFTFEQLTRYKAKACKAGFSKISNVWDIFADNGKAIQSDFALLKKGRRSASLNETVNVIGNGDIFVEKGFKAEYITINTTTGPVYLGKNAEIMEGSMIRGPFAMCNNTVVKLGAKIYGPTTLGPHVKVGGEINNSVFFGFSNKAHDGFLGNSVIAEWCNIGADSNNSNLKNNYAEVRLWNYPQGKFIPTGLQFCGLIMADHSKCGINSMFNTGTVVGVNCNLFGSGFPRNYIPSFSWGGAHGMMEYSVEKAVEVAARVMERRNIVFNAIEQEILANVFEMTKVYRKY